MKKVLVPILLLLASMLLLTAPSFGQTKKKKTTTKTKKAATKTTTTATTSTEPVDNGPAPLKKNERPADAAGTDGTVTTQTPQKKNQGKSTTTAKTEIQYPYIYEFNQPDFDLSHYVIQHDENGKGKITFRKGQFSEDVTDPVQLSAATLERIKALFNVLNFLSSTEDYQSKERQYAHLGTDKITVRKDGRQREVTFNWSENKDAKALADEYRKIGDQYVWIFDINLARENQPLESPKLIDLIDSMIERNWISDPVQLLPFLTELSNDERIPLLGRNHLTRIIKSVEKKNSK